MRCLYPYAYAYAYAYPYPYPYSYSYAYPYPYPYPYRYPCPTSTFTSAFTLAHPPIILTLATSPGVVVLREVPPTGRHDCRDPHVQGQLQGRLLPPPAAALAATALIWAVR